MVDFNHGAVGGVETSWTGRARQMVSQLLEPMGGTRQDKVEQATTAPVKEPTPEEAGTLQQYYNKALQAIDDLRGKHYSMPKPVDSHGTGAPSEARGAATTAPAAETAPTAEVQRLSPQDEKVINGYAKWIVNLEGTRNDYTNKTGKLPPALPLNVAENNLMGTVKYVMQSHETDGFTDQRKAMEECLKAAGKDYKEAGDNALPFPLYLSKHMSRAGNEKKMFSAIAATGDEYVRSYHEKTPPWPEGVPYKDTLE